MGGKHHKDRSKHQRVEQPKDTDIKEVKFILLAVAIVFVAWFFVIPALSAPAGFLIPAAYAEDQTIWMAGDLNKPAHAGTGASCPTITGPSSATDGGPNTITHFDTADAGGCQFSTWTFDRTTTANKLLPEFFNDFLTALSIIHDPTTVSSFASACRHFEVSEQGVDPRLNITGAYFAINTIGSNIGGSIDKCSNGGLVPEFQASDTTQFLDSMSLNTTFFSFGVNTLSDERAVGTFDENMNAITLLGFTFQNPPQLNNTVWMMQEHPKFPTADLVGGFFGIDDTTFTMDSNTVDDTDIGQVVIFKEFNKTDVNNLDLRVVGGSESITSAADQWVRIEVKDGGYGTGSLVSFPDREYDVYQNGGSLGVVHVTPTTSVTAFDVSFTPNWSNSTAGTVTLLISVDDNSTAGSTIANLTSVEWDSAIKYDFEDINLLEFYETSIELGPDPLTRAGVNDYDMGILNVTNVTTTGVTPVTLPTPAAPTNADAIQQTNSTIDVVWNHNLLNVTDFRIERESPIGGGFSIIADTNNINRFYNDTGLTPSTEYNYKVCAVNGGILQPTCVTAAATTPSNGGQSYPDPYAYYDFDLNSISGSTITNLGTGGTIADGFMSKQTGAGVLDVGVNVTASIAAGTVNATGILGEAIITNDTGNNLDTQFSTWVEFGSEANKDQWHFLSEIDFGNDTTVVFWSNGDIRGTESALNLLMTGQGFGDLPSSYAIVTSSSEDPAVPRGWLYANDFDSGKTNKMNNAFGSPTVPANDEWHMITLRYEMDKKVNMLETCVDGTTSCTSYSSVVVEPLWNSTGTSGEPDHQLLLGPPAGFCTTPGSCESADDWSIDELGVWKGYRLTDAEINSIWNGSNGARILPAPPPPTVPTTSPANFALSHDNINEELDLSWDAVTGADMYVVQRLSTERQILQTNGFTTTSNFGTSLSASNDVLGDDSAFSTEGEFPTRSEILSARFTNVPDTGTTGLVNYGYWLNVISGGVNQAAPEVVGELERAGPHESAGSRPGGASFDCQDTPGGRQIEQLGLTPLQDGSGDWYDGSCKAMQIYLGSQMKNLTAAEVTNAEVNGIYRDDWASGNTVVLRPSGGGGSGWRFTDATNQWFTTVGLQVRTFSMNNTWINVTTTASTSFSDPALDYNTYFYRVIATGGGQEGPPGIVLNGTLSRVPERVPDLNATDNGSTVDLEWFESPIFISRENSEDPVQGYIIQRATGSNETIFYDGMGSAGGFNHDIEEYFLFNSEPYLTLITNPKPSSDASHAGQQINVTTAINVTRIVTKMGCNGGCGNFNVEPDFRGSIHHANGTLIAETITPRLAMSSDLGGSPSDKGFVNWIFAPAVHLEPGEYQFGWQQLGKSCNSNNCPDTVNRSFKVFFENTTESGNDSTGWAFGRDVLSIGTAYTSQPLNNTMDYDMAMQIFVEPTWETIGTTIDTDLNFTDASPPPGITKAYRVLAFNDAGISHAPVLFHNPQNTTLVGFGGSQIDFFPEDSQGRQRLGRINVGEMITIVVPPPIPEQVENLTATAGVDGITLDWDAAGNTTAYRIYRTSTETGDTEIFVDNSSPVSFPQEFDTQTLPESFGAGGQGQYDSTWIGNIPVKLSIGLDVDPTVTGGTLRGCIFEDMSFGQDNISCDSISQESIDLSVTSVVDSFETFNFRDEQLINITSIDQGTGAQINGTTGTGQVKTRNGDSGSIIGNTLVTQAEVGGDPDDWQAAGKDTQIIVNVLNQTKLTVDPEVSTTASTSTTLLDTNVSEDSAGGHTYFYRVVGLNEDLVEGAGSNIANATKLPDAPAAPTGVTAIQDGDDITIDWTKEPAADGYNILRKATNDTTSKVRGDELPLDYLKVNDIPIADVEIAGIRNAGTVIFNDFTCGGAQPCGRAQNFTMGSDDFTLDNVRLHIQGTGWTGGNSVLKVGIFNGSSASNNEILVNSTTVYTSTIGSNPFPSGGYQTFDFDDYVLEADQTYMIGPYTNGSISGNINMWRDDSAFGFTNYETGFDNGELVFVNNGDLTNWTRFNTMNLQIELIGSQYETIATLGNVDTFTDVLTPSDEGNLFFYKVQSLIGAVIGNSSAHVNQTASLIPGSDLFNSTSAVWQFREHDSNGPDPTPSASGAGCLSNCGSGGEFPNANVTIGPQEGRVFSGTENLLNLNTGLDTTGGDAESNDRGNGVIYLFKIFNTTEITGSDITIAWEQQATGGTSLQNRGRVLVFDGLINKDSGFNFAVDQSVRSNIDGVPGLLGDNLGSLSGTEISSDDWPMTVETLTDIAWENTTSDFVTVVVEMIDGDSGAVGSNAGMYELFIANITISEVGLWNFTNPQIIYTVDGNRQAAVDVCPRRCMDSEKGFIGERGYVNATEGFIPSIIPPAPTIVTATASISNVIVNWTAVISTPAVDTYYIERKPGAATYFDDFTTDNGWVIKNSTYMLVDTNTGTLNFTTPSNTTHQGGLRTGGETRASIDLEEQIGEDINIDTWSYRGKVVFTEIDDTNGVINASQHSGHHQAYQSLFSLTEDNATEINDQFCRQAGENCLGLYSNTFHRDWQLHASNATFNPSAELNLSVNAFVNADEYYVQVIKDVDGIRASVFIDDQYSIPWEGTDGTLDDFVPTSSLMQISYSIMDHLMLGVPSPNAGNCEAHIFYTGCSFSALGYYDYVAFYNGINVTEAGIIGVAESQGSGEFEVIGNTNGFNLAFEDTFSNYPDNATAALTWIPITTGPGFEDDIRGVNTTADNFVFKGNSGSNAAAYIDFETIAGQKATDSFGNGDWSVRWQDQTVEAETGSEVPYFVGFYADPPLDLASGTHTGAAAQWQARITTGFNSGITIGADDSDSPGRIVVEAVDFDSFCGDASLVFPDTSPLDFVSDSLVTVYHEFNKTGTTLNYRVGLDPSYSGLGCSANGVTSDVLADLKYFGISTSGSGASTNPDVTRFIDNLEIYVNGTLVEFFIDTTVENAANYNYRVFAENSLGNGTGTISNSVLTNDIPVQVTGLTAQRLIPTQIDLSWDEVPDDSGIGSPSTGVNLTKYQIFRSENGGAFTLVGENLRQSPPAIIFNDTSVNELFFYSYEITACNDLGCGTNSSSFFIATPPEQPTNLTATADIADVILDWTGNSTTDEDYRIERKLGQATYFDDFTTDNGWVTNNTAAVDIFTGTGTINVTDIATGTSGGSAPFYSSKITLDLESAMGEAWNQDKWTLRGKLDFNKTSGGSGFYTLLGVSEADQSVMSGTQDATGCESDNSDLDDFERGCLHFLGASHHWRMGLKNETDNTNGFSNINLNVTSLITGELNTFYYPELIVDSNVIRMTVYSDPNYLNVLGCNLADGTQAGKTACLSDVSQGAMEVQSTFSVPAWDDLQYLWYGQADNGVGGGEGRTQGAHHYVAFYNGVNATEDEITEVFEAQGQSEFEIIVPSLLDANVNVFNEDFSSYPDNATGNAVWIQIPANCVAGSGGADNYCGVNATSNTLVTKMSSGSNRITYDLFGNLGVNATDENGDGDFSLLWSHLEDDQGSVSGNNIVFLLSATTVGTLTVEDAICMRFLGSQAPTDTQTTLHLADNQSTCSSFDDIDSNIEDGDADIGQKRYWNLTKSGDDFTTEIHTCEERTLGCRLTLMSASAGGEAYENLRYIKFASYNSGSNSFDKIFNFDDISLSINGTSLLTSYRDTNVTLGTGYTYRVTALNSTIPSLPSEEASVITNNIPFQVVNLDATFADATTVSIDWDDLAFDSGIGVQSTGLNLTSYKIFRENLTAATPFELAAEVFASSPPPSFFNDTAVSFPDIFNYQVSGCNVLGCGANSSSVLTEVTVVPDPVVNMVATAVDSTVSLDWDDSLFALNYTVLRSFGESVVGFNENFSSYTTQPQADTAWPTTDASRLEVNIATDELDFDSSTGSSPFFSHIYHDLGSQLNDNDWTLRFKYDVTTQVDTTAADGNAIIVGLGSVIGGENVLQDFIGFNYISFSLDAKHYRNTFSDGTAVPVTTGDPFTHLPTVETLWIEMIRISPTSYSTEFFSDSSFTTSIEKVTTTIPSTIKNLQYIKVMEFLGNGGTADGSFIGSIDDVVLPNSTFSSFDIIAEGVLTSDYIDSTVAQNTNYTYGSWAVNDVGNSTTGTSNSVITNDLPDAPFNLTGTMGQFIPDLEDVFIDWNHALDNGTGSPSTGVDVTKYQIERKQGVGAFSFLANTTDATPMYEDETVISGANYTYQVRGVNTLGFSPFSNSFSIITTPLMPPDAPTNLTATTLSQSEIRIDWLAPVGGDPPAEYVIQQRHVGFGGFVTIDTVPVPTLTFTDSGLAIANTYDYQVRADNGAGAGPYSNIAQNITFGIVTAPLNLAATATSDTEIDLDWDEPNEVGAGVVKYNIEQESPIGGGFSEIAEIVNANTPEELFLDDLFNNNGTIWQYRQAKAGVGIAFSTCSISTAAGDRVQCLWSDGGGSTGTAYIFKTFPRSFLNNTQIQISMSETDTTFASPHTAKKTTVTADEPNYLDRNREAEWPVLAVRNFGVDILNGSSPVPIVEFVGGHAVLPDDDTPQTFDMGTGSNDWQLAGNSNYSSIIIEFFDTNSLASSARNNIFWINITDIDTGDQRAFYNFTGASRTVEAQDAGCTPKCSRGTITAGPSTFINSTGFETQTLNATDTQFTVTGLTTKTEYNFRVNAENLVGTGPYSNEADDVTFGVPGPPINLGFVTNGISEITVDWDEPANDFGSAVTGYRIDQAQGIGGTFVTVIADTGDNIEPLDELFIGLLQQTTYVYRIGAINGFGLGDFSANLTAGTFTGASAPENFFIQFNATKPYSVFLSWETPLFDGGQPLLGYLVERKDTGGVFQLIANLTSPTLLNYTDTNLLNLAVHEYRVAAYTNPTGDFATDSTVTFVPANIVDFTVDDFNVVGDILRQDYSFVIDDCFPACTLTQADLERNGITEANWALSEPITLDTELNFTTYFVIPIVGTQNINTTAIVTNLGGFGDEETGVVTTQIQFVTDLLFFNHTRINDFEDVQFNLTRKPIPWSINCDTRETSFAIKESFGKSGVGSFIEILDATPSLNLYVSCEDPIGTQILAFTSFGQGNGTLALTAFTNQLGDFMGVPIPFIFIIILAAIWTGRSAPTGIIVLAVAIGSMGVLGYFEPTSGKPTDGSLEFFWGFIVFLTLLGVFIGKRYF